MISASVTINHTEPCTAWDTGLMEMWSLTPGLAEVLAMGMCVHPLRVQSNTCHMSHSIPTLEGFQGKGEAVPATQESP